MGCGGRTWRQIMQLPRPAAAYTHANFPCRRAFAVVYQCARGSCRLNRGQCNYCQNGNRLFEVFVVAGGGLFEGGVLWRGWEVECGRKTCSGVLSLS